MIFEGLSKLILARQVQTFRIFCHGLFWFLGVIDRGQLKSIFDLKIKNLMLFTMNFTILVYLFQYDVLFVFF